MQGRDPVEAPHIFEAVKAQFSEAVVATDDTVKSPFITIAAPWLLQVMQFLRDEPTLRFDMLLIVTGVDYPDSIASVYHLTSIGLKHHVAVKVHLPREQPEVDSVSALWPAADWHERETFDMMGIVYKGHPNLRRILCPEDWEGYPLRKDYQQPEEYHGISNVRQIGDDFYPKPDEDSKAVQGWKPPKAPPAPAAPKAEKV